MDWSQHRTATLLAHHFAHLVQTHYGFIPLAVPGRYASLHILFSLSYSERDEEVRARKTVGRSVVHPADRRTTGARNSSRRFLCHHAIDECHSRTRAFPLGSLSHGSSRRIYDILRSSRRVGRLARYVLFRGMTLAKNRYSFCSSP